MIESGLMWLRFGSSVNVYDPSADSEGE